MIVVTGATGNIGAPLTRALAAAGERVTAVSRHPAPVPDGVRHLTADLAEPAALEDLVRESVPESAVLRPGGFASNALWWADSVRTGRLVAAPFGDVATPVVDPADIAEVAAACLLEDRHAGGVYELTGPEVISPRGQTAALSAALGVLLRFQELSRAEAGAAMARSMPVELADDTLDILGAPSAAELRVAPGVREVLGRDPRSFADWAARHVDAFR